MTETRDISTKAPKHLSRDSRRLWADVTGAFVLEPHHLAILRVALEALDRAQQARAILAAEGLTFVDKHGSPRAHPAASIERDNRMSFERLLRSLGLDLADADHGVIAAPAIVGKGNRTPAKWRP